MSTIKAKVKKWEQGLRAKYNVDRSTPENLRKNEFYNRWLDHAILRKHWTNFFEISPGVYRSNHPTHERLIAMKALGISTVLTLRGLGNTAYNFTEIESCESLGLTLVQTSLHARQAPEREKIVNLIKMFRSLEKPFVFHCKSGADRAGLASAIYLMVFDDVPVAEAKKMLSFKYLHIKRSGTGVLDRLLDTFEDYAKRTPISFEEWVENVYDHTELQADFDNNRSRKF